MKNNFGRPLYIGLLYTFLMVHSQILAQDQLHIRAKYTITYNKEVLGKEGSRITALNFKKKGIASNHQILKWNLIVRRDEKKILLPIVIEIPAGNSDLNFEKRLMMNDVIEAIQDVSIIDPISITLPNSNDFNLRIKSLDEFILEGEKVTLFVDVKEGFNDIEWIWSNNKKGDQISHTAFRNQSISVYGVYKGTSFKTMPKSLTLDVKSANELIDFAVMTPTIPIDDTSQASISLKVLKNSLTTSPSWVWYDEFGAELRSTILSQVFNGKPYFKTGIISVCPMYGNRIFGCKKIQIPVRHLEAPSPNFEIIYPSELYSDKEAVIYIRQKFRNINTKWNWTINGKRLNLNSDSIKIYPQQKLEIAAYPSLNNRIAEVKKVTLKNVIVRTKLPETIKGTFRFCGVQTSSHKYTLDKGELGNDAKSWILYKNNIEYKRFVSNYFDLIPIESAEYHLSPDTKPNLKISFYVEVVKSPEINLTIKGPQIVCKNEIFSLQLISLVSDTAFTFIWYKNNSANQTVLVSSGTNRFITDSITSTTAYSLEIQYKSCKIPEMTSYVVQLYNSPSTPTVDYTFTNKVHDQISLMAESKSESSENWEWSIDNFSTIYSLGKNIEKYKLKDGSNQFFVRYRNQCNEMSYIKDVTIFKKKYNYFFINIGINSNTLNSIQSYNFTAGSKKWYIRGKFSPSYFLKNNFSTELYGKNLEVNDNGRILNYPISTGTYYITNGTEIISRAGISTGLMFGSGSSKLFGGIGYGSADILWGFNTYSYSNNILISSSYAKNLSKSSKGIEAEIGMFIKIKKINLMPGISVIYDTKNKISFFEFNFGIGFSNK
jgi:hypothetical protein